MARLALSFLSTFQATLDARPITHFRSSNNQGLLVYLALQTGRPFPRELLATLFWPEEPEDAARNNLRQSLYQLRKVLGDLDPSEEPYLLATRQTVQFNPNSDFTLDVDRFLEAIDRDDLEAAVAGYPGELLPGFTCDSLAFEEWVRLERERLHQVALEAMFEVTREHLGAGRLDKAQAVARKQLTLEPWREQAHRQLMRAFALAGDRANALAQYELCREQLWAELAVEPAAETIALYADIREGRIGPITTEEPLQPPVKVRHNLPADTTPFIGRELELSQIGAALTADYHRLVTVVGAGGMGKTRLALAVGRQILDHFAHGVYFVDLAPLAHPDEIMPAMASALDYQAPDNAQALAPQLLAMLGRRHLLLILDNFEHLLSGTSLVNEILQACPQLAILVTSRQRLNLASESRYELGGLDFPDSPTVKEAADFTAVRLFVDAGRRAQYDFELTGGNVLDVVRICQQVQGMPLALVLAAAWLELLAPAEIAAEIEASLAFLAADLADLPERQRNMRAVFARSWEMMTPEEQRVMAALSIFRGGFSREAAGEVARANLRILLSLAAKSLLQRQPDSGRFHVHELLRQFAAGKRRKIDAAGEAGLAHCRYFARLMAREAWRHLSFFADPIPRKYAADHDNIRRAWDYALEQGLAQELSDLVAGVVAFNNAQGIRGAAIPRQALRSLQERGLPDTDPVMLHLRLRELGSQVGIDDSTWVEGGFLDLIPVMEEGGRLELLFWAYERLGFIAMDKYYLDNNRATLEWLAKAYDTALKMGDEVYIKMAKARILWSRNYTDLQVDEPLAQLQELLSFFEPEFRDSFIYYGLLDSLSVYYRSVGEYEKAIEYGRQGLNIVKGWQNLFWIGFASQTLANTYMKMGLESQTDAAVLDTIDWHLAIGQVWEILGILWSTVVNFPGQVEVGLGVQILSMVYQHPEAIPYYRQRIEQARSEFEGEMGVDAFAAAWEKGKSLEFDTAVARLREALIRL